MYGIFTYIHQERDYPYIPILFGWDWVSSILFDPGGIWILKGKTQPNPRVVTVSLPEVGTKSTNQVCWIDI